MEKSEGLQNLIQQKVRSPRSAAFAGILYSLLFSTSAILLGTGAIIDPAEIGTSWLEARSVEASVVLTLVSFAGISFLWFTGVIRDRLGGSEDKFFSTIFFGSGIILVVMMFIWAAAYGAIIGTYRVTAGFLNDLDVFVYASQFSNQIIGNYFLRMAAVYMLSIGSLWTRTRTMPRWLSILTFIVAVLFLVLAGQLRWIRFIFPAWVLLVSVYVLILNYRHNQDVKGNTIT